MPLPEWLQNLRSKVGHDLVMMTGTLAVVRNGEGEILLHLRTDVGFWGLPGGAVDPGEEPAATVVREVREETGLEVQPTRIVGIYGSDVVQYPNQDRVAFVTIVFECRAIGGEINMDIHESQDVRWFKPDALPEKLINAHRQRIEHALTRSEPYFKHT